MGADLERLAAAKASIGSHSMTHANFRSLSEDERRAELEDSRAAMSQHLGTAPSLFAIPYGRARDWSDECTTLASNAGYAAVFAQSEERRPKGTVARSFIGKYDGLPHFRAVLDGRFDRWEEWF